MEKKDDQPVKKVSLNLTLLSLFCLFTLGVIIFLAKPLKWFHRAEERPAEEIEMSETLPSEELRAEEATMEELSAASPPVRGQAGDFWADFVLGQRNFNETVPYEVVNDRLLSSNGLALDRTVKGRILYVLDGSNNRVIGVELRNCLKQKKANRFARCQAFKVIGQPDFSSSACNSDSSFQNYPQRAPASASSLCYISESELDPRHAGYGASFLVDAGGSLYLPDLGNNRVLRYDRVTGTDGVADEVWGQADFADNRCNKGRTTAGVDTLCFAPELAGGVNLDASGNLWVADSANHRVLRFSKQANRVISKQADLVLGQANFNLRRSGNSLNSLNTPTAVDFDSEGKLYVTDRKNDRVLVYNQPFRNGMAGQVFGSNFKAPSAVKIEKISPGSDKVWIGDVGNSKVEIWNNQGTVVLETLLYDNEPFGPFGSFEVDDERNILIGSNGGSNIDVFYFILGHYKDSVGVAYPEFLMFNRYGKEYLSYEPVGYNSIGPRGIDRGKGIAVAGNQLIAADVTRLLFWNNLESLSNGRPIDGMTEESWNCEPGGGVNLKTMGYNKKQFVKKDEVGNLWLTTAPHEDNPALIEVYKLPLSCGERPFKTIYFGMAYTYDEGWLDRYFLTLEGEKITNPDSRTGGFGGIVPAVDGSYVWVVHPLSNRVLRLRNPLGNNPRVDVVLGQADANGICCNREAKPDGTCKNRDKTTRNPGLNMLCTPSAVAVDRKGNLYVSDRGGNGRILIFKKEDLPLDNNQTLYGVPAFKEIKNIGAMDMVFDLQNRMIVGQDGGWGFWQNTHFLAYFDDPLRMGQPSGYFKDYFSVGWSLAFDQNNNLFVSDKQRSKILVYQNPFNQPGVLHNVDHPVQNETYPAAANFSGWTAWDNGERVEKVEFYLDGTKEQVTKHGEALCNESRPDLPNPYKNSGWHLPFNPETISPGRHRLFIYAVDGQGNNLGVIIRKFINRYDTVPTPTQYFFQYNYTCSSNNTCVKKLRNPIERILYRCRGDIDQSLGNQDCQNDCFKNPDVTQANPGFPFNACLGKNICCSYNYFLKDCKCEEE